MLNRTFTRERLLRAAAGGVAGTALSRLLEDVARAGIEPPPDPAPAPTPVPSPDFSPELRFLAVTNGGRPYAGDHRLLTTVSPAERARRTTAYLHFQLDRTATVELDAVTTRKTIEKSVWQETARLGPGAHRIEWTPEPGLEARTYLLRLTVTDDLGRRSAYGGDRATEAVDRRAPVVRLLGVEAVFSERSYSPGDRAKLRVESDAEELTVQLFHCGPETTPTFRNDEMSGVEMTDPVTIDWRRKRRGPGEIKTRIGEWPGGLYFARLVADDGRIGYAPFVLRPATFGRSRVAVVLPTNTWAAYNHRDADGDGWGDTWYAGGNPPVELVRPNLGRGVPFRFKTYDVGFIRWLHRTRKEVEFLAEDDLERFRSGDQLAALYDLIIFPGHTEYVTEHEYDVIERYRDLGGNLWFLSANNFFWRVKRRGTRLYREALWRDLGRPEAALIGVQYLANDDGSRQGPYVVGQGAPAWAWEGTGVGPGARFGGYGIEIDARTPDTPPGTQVLATIPDVFGPGRSAEMTYYELANGAKVFAGGVLNFGGTADRWSVRKLLENVWARTSVP